MKIFLGLFLSFLLSSSLVFGQIMPPGGTSVLTVNKSGSGSGVVTSSPSGINCGATCSANFNQGINVSLSATADSGSVFGGWQGVCSGTGSCMVNMFSNMTVMAIFNLSGDGGGGGGGGGDGNGGPPPPIPPPAGSPTISSIEPRFAGNDQTVDINIRGANFTFNTTGKLTKSGEADIIGVNSSFINSGLIIFTFDIRDRTVGDRTLSVTNSGGTATYNSFTINEPSTDDTKKELPLGSPPILTSISPSAGYNELELNDPKYYDPDLGLGFKINIYGANFDEGSIAYLIKGEEYLAPSYFEFINPNLLFGYFDLTGAPAGFWDLIIFNSDGQWAQLSNAFNIIEAPTKGIFDKGRFFPQSGLKYTVDILNKWLGGDGGGEEEQLAPPEEIFIPEPEEENFEEYAFEETNISPSIFNNSFNRWQVILELIKEKTNLFINKVVGLFIF